MSDPGWAQATCPRARSRVAHASIPGDSIRGWRPLYCAEYAGVRRRADRGAKRRQRGRLTTCLIGLHEQRLNVYEMAGLRARRD